MARDRARTARRDKVRTGEGRDNPRPADATGLSHHLNERHGRLFKAAFALHSERLPLVGCSALRHEPEKHALLAAHVRAPAPNTLSSQTANPFLCRSPGRRSALRRASLMPCQAPRPRSEDASPQHLQSASKNEHSLHRSDSWARRRIACSDCFRTVHSARDRSLPERGAEPPAGPAIQPQARQLLTQPPRLSPLGHACVEAGHVRIALGDYVLQRSETSSAGRCLPRPKFAEAVSGASIPSPAAGRKEGWVHPRRVNAGNICSRNAFCGERKHSMPSRSASAIEDDR